MTEVMVKLPPEAQAIAFDILKGADAYPWAWEFIRRFFLLIAISLVEKYIADLKLLQGDES